MALMEPIGVGWLIVRVAWIAWTAAAAHGPGGSRQRRMNRGASRSGWPLSSCAEAWAGPGIAAMANGDDADAADVRR
jgi:hypothetical protein